MPKPAKKEKSLLIYKHAIELMAQASEASRKVLEENRRLGIPSPFSLHNRVYYLMPDGRIRLQRKKNKGKS